MKRSDRHHPPTWATKFLRWFYRRDLLEEIEGDLVEIFEKQRRKSSLGHARRNYLWNVLRAIRWSNLRKPQISHLFDIRQDVKIALRQIRFRRSISFIKILGFALGLAPCIIIGLFVRYESSFDRAHFIHDRSYRIVQHTQFPEQMLYWNTTAYPLAAALRNDFANLELVTQVAGPMTQTFKVQKGGEQVVIEEPRAMFADSLFTQMFALDWMAGHKERALSGAHQVALSVQAAEKYFGHAPNPADYLGKEIFFEDRPPLIVKGIFAKPGTNSSLNFDVLISYAFFREGNPYFANNWSGNYQGTTFTVLKPGSNPVELAYSINKWKKKYLIPEDDRRITYHLQPVHEMHTETRYGNSPGSYIMPKAVLYGASFAGFFILLISIFNFINLTTAQSRLRRYEVGVRKILGGTHSVLLRQLMVEYALFVILSALLAVAIVVVALPYLNQFLKKIELVLSFSTTDILPILSILIFTIIVASLMPALNLSSIRLLESIKRLTVRPLKRKYGLRQSLVFVQFVLVQIFVMAAIVVSLQMAFFRGKDLGFKTEGIVSTPVPNSQKLDPYRSALLQHPAIEEVAFGSGPPMNVDGFKLGTTFRSPQESMEMGQEAEMKIGDKYYLDFYDLTLVAGSFYDENKPTFDAFVVNEKLVQAMGWDINEAVGKSLAINEGEGQIVGIVRDFHNNSLHDEVGPCVFVNWRYFLDHAFIKISALDQVPLTDIERIWDAHSTDKVFSHRFLDESIEREYHLEQTIFTGIRIFSLLVISIACLGVFGLMMFVTQQRQKEISIRKVLGATVMQIVRLLGKDLIWILVGSFLLAAPTALWLSNVWLDNFAHHISLQLWMFLLAGFITLTIALATSSAQTLRVALSNPVNHLEE